MNLTADLTIRIDRVKKSRVEDIDFASVGFSAVFSDHMFVAEYGEGRWQQAGIRPYGPITIAPSISALHYGLSVFEGLKAHKAIDGVPLLFRPRDNACRFQRSAARLAMPVVPEDLFLEALRELVRLDAAWVPPADVGALYVRPLLFSTDPSIRVKPAERCQFLIVTFPFGAYFSAPVDMLVTERVKEERIGIDEVFQSFERGELRECFGTGTAATVSHIRRIRYRNQRRLNSRQSIREKSGRLSKKNCCL